jgi:hypothetical protein
VLPTNGCAHAWCCFHMQSKPWRLVARCCTWRRGGRQFSREQARLARPSQQLPPPAHLMLACEKAAAVPLRISAQCSSSGVVKKLRRPRWLVACARGRSGAAGRGVGLEALQGRVCLMSDILETAGWECLTGPRGSGLRWWWWPTVIMHPYAALPGRAKHSSCSPKPGMKLPVRLSDPGTRQARTRSKKPYPMHFRGRLPTPRPKIVATSWGSVTRTCGGGGQQQSKGGRCSG